MSAKYDAVVVGLGGVGSMALRALAHDMTAWGGRFLGVERYAARVSADDRVGSSIGKSRIYRRAYFEHEHYVPWIEYSLDQFRNMEEESNVSLMQRCGSIIMESSASLSNPDELPKYVAQSKLSAALHNVPVELYNSNELPERFPQFRYNPQHKMVGILEPGGGFLRPELCMETAIEQAEAPSNGSIVDILDNAVVSSVKNVKVGSGDEPIELVVIQDDGTEHHVTTDCLLVAAGSWTGQLIPEWAPHLNVVRQVQTWIDVSHADDGGELYSYKNMPAFVYCSPDFPKHGFYGLPCDSDDTTGFANYLKLGLHKQTGDNAALNKDPSINKEPATEEELAEMKRAISLGINSRAWNREADVTKPMPEITATKPCLYTVSPDLHYMVGEPQGYQNVFAVAGLSGHGFKMVPALGQMMADYALGKEMKQWRMDFCSPERFGV